MMHPCIVQLRGFEDLEDIFSIARKYNATFEDVGSGIDMYFEDVNEARRFISVLKKLRRFEVKFSTKYAGLRRGRVRVLFVYCLRAR